MHRTWLVAPAAALSLSLIAAAARRDSADAADSRAAATPATPWRELLLESASGGTVLLDEVGELPTGGKRISMPLRTFVTKLRQYRMGR